ncbi:MAG: carboxypeptidase-like regulatory domain-containing protein, partial [Flectobacillus sp.]|nr:carboxypeptidase-like regulatory domain-containing protein [Flectobacillus sp.]
MQHYCISEDFMLPLQFITTDTPLKSFSIFLLFILLTNSSLGQTNPCDCHIKGTVRDKETGKALVGINVQLKGANKGMVSTSKGEFSFKGLCPGSYTLITSAVGYQASEQHFDLAKEHESNVLLEEADEHLQEVLVVGKQHTITSQASSNVSGNALEQTRGNSLGEALKAITGVTTLQTGSSISKPVIHGMHS